MLVVPSFSTGNSSLYASNKVFYLYYLIYFFFFFCNLFLGLLIAWRNTESSQGIDQQLWYCAIYPVIF